MALVTEARVNYTITPYDPDLAEPLTDINGRAAVMLTLAITDSGSTPIDLLVFQMEPREAGQADVAFFSNVASQNDIEELPNWDGVSALDASVSLFRYHTAQFMCRSLFEANYIREEVEKDIRELVRSNEVITAGLLLGVTSGSTEISTTPAVGASASQDIRIVQGSTIELPFMFWTDLTRTEGLDFSVGSAQMQVRSDFGVDPPVLDIDSDTEIELLDGTGEYNLRISLTDVVTTALPAPFRGVYDLEYTDDEANVSKLLRGQFIIDPEVTT